MATSPIFALVFAHIFTEDDRFTLFKCISVALGFSAVMVLALPSGNLLDSSNLLAKFATLMAAMSYVIAGLLTRKLDEKIGARSITSIVLVLSVLLLAPAAFLQGFSALDTYSNPSLFSLLYLGVFSTALALLIRYSLILQVGYTFVSYTGFLVPVFAVIFGALLLDEQLSMNAYIALLLVLLALAISRLNPQTFSSIVNLKRVNLKERK